MKSVVILGASADRAKFGNKAVRAFQQQGWTVYPVNPKEMEVEGLPCFRSIAEVPVRPRMVSVYLPPPVLLNVLPDLADVVRGKTVVCVMSGGNIDQAKLAKILAAATS